MDHPLRKTPINYILCQSKMLQHLLYTFLKLIYSAYLYLSNQYFMPRPDSRISYITIGVTKLELMIRFYEAIGFRIWRKSDNTNHPYCMFSSASIVLALYPKQLLAKQSGCNMSGLNTSISLSLNVREKSLVNHYLENAQAHGAEITRQAFTPDWGGYCGYFKDPEENLWEIVWHENFDWTA